MLKSYKLHWDFSLNGGVRALLLILVRRKTMVWTELTQGCCSIHVPWTHPLCCPAGSLCKGRDIENIHRFSRNRSKEGKNEPMEHGKKLDLFRVVIEKKMCSFVGPAAHTAHFVKYLPFFPETPVWTGLWTPGKELTSGHRGSKSKE